MNYVTLYDYLGLRGWGFNKKNLFCNWLAFLFLCIRENAPSSKSSIMERLRSIIQIVFFDRKRRKKHHRRNIFIFNTYLCNKFLLFFRRAKQKKITDEDVNTTSN